MRVLERQEHEKSDDRDADDYLLHAVGGRCERGVAVLGSGGRWQGQEEQDDAQTARGHSGGIWGRVTGAASLWQSAGEHRNVSVPTTSGAGNVSANRRAFLERLAGGAAAVGGLPLVLPAEFRTLLTETPDAQSAAWDMTWVKRVTGKHRAVFDVPEIESGYGVWRSTIWMNQYRETLGAADKDLCTVLVLRHNAIALAMTQAFWDEHGLGKAKSVTHPLTQEPTDRNPALLGERDGVPAPFATFALPEFIARGGIVLACNLAFADCVDLVKKKHGLADDAARARALSALVPRVILQPSGVFAAVRAQETDAVYIRAS